MPKMTKAEKLEEAKREVRAAARARVAAKKKKEAAKKKIKSPSLGSGMAEKARKKLGGRGRQIEAEVNKALLRRY
jgi:hypothetical protein